MKDVSDTPEPPATSKALTRGDANAEGTITPSRGAPSRGAPSRSVQFRSGQSLDIVRDETSEHLLLRAENGACIMRIEMTDRGPVFVIQGDAIAISANSVLSLRAPHLKVEADSISMDVRDDVDIQARQISATARLGNILIHANDDVNIKGERVRLNSEDPPMPLSWDEFAERKLARQRVALQLAADEATSALADEAGRD